MKKRVNQIFGCILFLAGVSLIKFKIQLTGAVIGTNLSAGLNSIAGLILIIGGFWLFIFGHDSEGGLVKIIKPENFLKKIKKYNPKPIEDAIEKIGTGKGKEEKLRGREDYSIRVTKGGRIIFEYNDAHTIATLTDYLPDHKY